MDNPNHTIDFIWEAEQDEPPALSVHPFIEKLFCLLELNGRPRELSIKVINDPEMHRMNLDFRGLDKSTDVLSFPSLAIPQSLAELPTVMLGDILISVDQAERQAGQIGHSIQLEIRFLILHGVLHLLGYDHETDEGEMDRLQSQLKMELQEFFS